MPDKAVNKNTWPKNCSGKGDVGFRPSAWRNILNYQELWIPISSPVTTAMICNNVFSGYCKRTIADEIKTKGCNSHLWAIAPNQCEIHQREGKCCKKNNRVQVAGHRVVLTKRPFIYQTPLMLSFHLWSYSQTIHRLMGNDV